MAKTKRREAKLGSEVPPQQRIQELLDCAIKVARTARKNRRSLSGANFYANKMAGLRAEATNALGRISGGPAMDREALAELMQKVFSADALPKDRAQAARDVAFELKTNWAGISTDYSRLEDAGVFPLVTLTQTRRGYLVSVGRQMNGCYAAGWYDSCAVMMRRLLESVIIEAFEAKHIESKIKDGNGDFVQLTPLIDAALADGSWNLPRNVRKELKGLRDLGHRSAHNRYYLAKKPDIDKYLGVYREAVEAFLHLAALA